MWRKFKFILAVVLLFILITRLTSVAYGNNNSGATLAGVRIEAAAPLAAPQVVFFGNAHGSITPGDLFYLDAAGISGDIAVTLYLTNVHELTHYLRYLILEATVYAESADGQCLKSPSRHNLAPENDVYLTLQQNTVKFILPGGARYKIRIDSGEYCSFPAEAHGANQLPRFNLAVEPA